jgi:hypothetical protein
MVLPGYLLLRHSYTWEKTSIFWSCQKARLGPKSGPVRTEQEHRLQKGHNPRTAVVSRPYSSHGVATHTAGSLDLDVLAPEPWAFHSSAPSLAPLG